MRLPHCKLPAQARRIVKSLGKLPSDLKDVEFFRPVCQQSKTWHTDSLRSIEPDDITKQDQWEDMYVMDEDTYNETILANCGQQACDLDMKFPVLCVRLKYRPDAAN